MSPYSISWRKWEVAQLELGHIKLDCGTKSSRSTREIHSAMQNNVILIPALPFPKPEEIFGPVVKVSRSETHKFTSDVGECVSSKFVMMRNLAQAV